MKQHDYLGTCYACVCVCCCSTFWLFLFRFYTKLCPLQAKSQQHTIVNSIASFEYSVYSYCICICICVRAEMGLRANGERVSTYEVPLQLE